MKPVYIAAVKEVLYFLEKNPDTGSFLYTVVYSFSRSGKLTEFNLFMEYCPFLVLMLIPAYYGSIHLVAGGYKRINRKTLMHSRVVLVVARIEICS